jgi:hypothetical protein
MHGLQMATGLSSGAHEATGLSAAGGWNQKTVQDKEQAFLGPVSSGSPEVALDPAGLHP